MPFYDAKDLITDGNKIDINSNLNKKAIKYVLPYDKNHKLLVSLTEKNENYKDINSIRVVFENGKTKDYDVTFKDFYGHVASYTIDELNIEYNYNKYIINNLYLKDFFKEVLQIKIIINFYKFIKTTKY